MGVVHATMEYYYCSALAALAVVDGILHTNSQLISLMSDTVEAHSCVDNSEIHL